MCVYLQHTTGKLCWNESLVHFMRCVSFIRLNVGYDAVCGSRQRGRSLCFGAEFKYGTITYRCGCPQLTARLASVLLNVFYYFLQTHTDMQTTLNT